MLEETKVEIPRRPKALGKLGKSTTVMANYYRMPQLPKGPFYHYSVEISEVVDADAQPKQDKARGPGKIPKAKCFRIYNEWVTKALQGRIHPAFDGVANVYYFQKLPNEAQNCRVTLPRPNGKVDEYQIKMMHVATIGLEKLSALLAGQKPTSEASVIVTVLDTILRTQTRTKFFTVGRTSFLRSDTEAIPGGISIVKGLFQSARPGGLDENGQPMGQMLVNVDTAASTVWTSGPLIDTIKSILGKDGMALTSLRDEDVNRVNKALRDVRFQVTHRGNIKPQYKFYKLAKTSAQNTFFKDENGQKISVIEYFKSKYNKDLEYKNMPCVIPASNIKTQIPIDVCEVVPDQVYRKKLNPAQTKDMIQRTTSKPQERVNKITRLVKEMDYANDPVLKEWGVRINHAEMTKVPARILPTPKVSSGKGVFTANRDQWNYVGSKLTKGATLDNWGVVALVNDREQLAITRMIDECYTVMTNLGMAVKTKPKPIFGNPQGNVPQFLNQAFAQATKAQGVPPSLIVCVLPSDNSAAYHVVKRWGDCTQGIVTQCMNLAKLRKPQGFNQYVTNVVLKINMKLGGENAKLAGDNLGTWFNQGPTIVIGADVTHPPVGSRMPSTAVVVGSVDRWCSRYNVRLHHQDSRQEVIQAFGTMVVDLLKQFYKDTNRQPGRIIIYRDGVSEGMYESIKTTEIDQLKKAVKALAETYNPKITYVAVQKRHHTRLFPMGNDDKDSSSNCKPGTVVENVICHPYQFDFFLQSHAGIQGTSRPTHYQVLHDENAFTADALQDFTYRLCYLFTRCTRAVSVVPCVYHADLAGYRARSHAKDINDWENPSSTSGSDSALPSDSYDQLNKNLSNVMWYI